VESVVESELVQAADGERDDQHGQRYGGDSDEDAENIGHLQPTLAVVTAQRASAHNSRPLKTSLRDGCGWRGSRVFLLSSAARHSAARRDRWFGRFNLDGRQRHIEHGRRRDI
jgi:hypothetical protein